MAVTKILQIDGQEVGFKASAAVPRMYRNAFGRDIYKDLAQLDSDIKDNNEEASDLPVFSLELFESLAWVMAKHYDPAGIPDNVEDFLERFNTFSIYQILPELLELWNDNTKTTVPKSKNSEKQSGK